MLSIAGQPGLEEYHTYDSILKIEQKQIKVEEHVVQL